MFGLAAIIINRDRRCDRGRYKYRKEKQREDVGE